MPEKSVDTIEISLPDAELQKIDAICDRFEADWKAGKQPKVDDYLGNVVEPARSCAAASCRPWMPYTVAPRHC